MQAARTNSLNSSMKNKHLPYQHGLSLIESLIAIVVLALGLLGILGAQMRTLANTQDSARRTQAIRLIDDLSERAKSHPNAIGQRAAFSTPWNTAANEPEDTDPTTTPAISDCKTTACTPSQLATYEVAQWRNSVEQTLPLGNATVFTTADPKQLGVMLAWRANENNAGAAAILAPPAASDAAGTTVNCPAERLCHLQYIALTQRCLPGGSADTAFCPGQ